MTPYQYTSQCPSVPSVPDSIRKFFETFYQISDTPDAHEEYADCFTENAVVVMASAKVEGREGELAPFKVRSRGSRIWLGMYHLLLTDFRLIVPPNFSSSSYKRERVQVPPLILPLALAFRDPSSLLEELITSFDGILSVWP